MRGIRKEKIKIEPKPRTIVITSVYWTDSRYYYFKITIIQAKHDWHVSLAYMFYKWNYHSALIVHALIWRRVAKTRCTVSLGETLIPLADADRVGLGVSRRTIGRIIKEPPADFPRVLRIKGRLYVCRSELETYKQKLITGAIYSPRSAAAVAAVA